MAPNRTASGSIFLPIAPIVLIFTQVANIGTIFDTILSLFDSRSIRCLAALIVFDSVRKTFYSYTPSALLCRRHLPANRADTSLGLRFVRKEKAEDDLPPVIEQAQTLNHLNTPGLQYQ